MEKEINILIVHYNTPLLTECLIKSINKFVPESKIYIFDNSDKFPFTYRQDNIIYFDNTKKQIIDFEKWLNGIKTKVSTGNNFASAKHCYTIQKCFELINDNFILLDSDTLLKKDITEIYDENYIYVADNEKWMGNERVIPYCCFINLKKCKAHNINYYNEKYVVGLTPHCRFDTGAYFFLQCKDFQHKKINYKDYVVHLDDGSQHYGNKTKQDKWLNDNKKLWETIEVKKLETMADYRNDIERIGKKIGLNFNLDNPKTIQDKIQWLKLHDTTPLKTKCADKVKVHEYCNEKLGKDICIPILKVYNNTNEIKWEELPQKFVIKCNHGSGMNIIVKDKNKLDKQDAVKKLNKWMKTDFAFQNGCELQYHNIERKIFVEKFEEDQNQKDSLLDYKFWCFNGKPKFMTITDGNGHGKMAFFDCNFNELDIRRTDFKRLENCKKPINFDLMIEYSKKLSEDFKFVRVDFYEINGETYLGELTFTPNSGFFKFTNEKYNKTVGDMLDLNPQAPKPEPKPRNKKVVYTCISGNYDTLEDPKIMNSDYDYICFTDQSFNSNVWQIKPIPEKLKDLSAVKRQRYIKVNAHEFLPEYDFSIWVDANITIKADLNNYVNKNCSEKDVVMFVGQHPQRNCIYDEGLECVRQKKETKQIVDKQLKRYKQEGFPKNYGLPQTCILFRYHNDESCKRLMKTWWEEIKNESHRDQLSFNYALWKNQNVKVKYLDKSIFDCETFKWGVAHRKVKQNSVLQKINALNSPKPNTSVNNNAVKLITNVNVTDTIEIPMIKTDVEHVDEVEFPKQTEFTSNKTVNLKEKVKQIKITRTSAKKLGDKYAMNDY